METKILIVEHDQNDLEFIMRELQNADTNFQTKAVQTKEDYENALNNFTPDLILSDYSMPHFSGLEAFNIRQVILPETPFIFVSGALGEERAVELIKNGATDYTLKDKLFSLNFKIRRALKEVKEKKEKAISEETIRVQNEKLFEIAFLQSHQVRRPVSSILGLIELIKKPPLNYKVIEHLETAAKELDSVIHEIVQKTNELKKML